MAHQHELRQQFDEWTQEILNHLYDSIYLQSHPLVERLFDSTVNAPDRSRNIRKAVLNAIDAVCPGAAAPAQSPDWRAYRILELRYVEGRQANEIMEQLGLGRSQYYREQARALEAVTVLLWAEWEAQLIQRGQETEDLLVDETGQSSKSTPRHEVTGSDVIRQNAVPPTASREEVAHDEAERLCSEANWKEIEVGELLQSLYPVIDSLAAASRVTVYKTPLGSITVPKADRVVLRQALLNVISYSVDTSYGGVLEIGPLTGARRRGLYISAHRNGSDIAKTAQTERTTAAQREGVGLEISQQLMVAMEGNLHIAQGGNYWTASFVWPVNDEAVLLIIDDNSMIDDLFQRYLAETNWQVVGVTNGDDARQIINKVRPRAILLDIMMPKVDGWELLSNLTTAPETQDIPVIICSVLNEPALATLLGAAAYLPKPVSQQQLRQVLAPYSGV